MCHSSEMLVNLFFIAKPKKMFSVKCGKGVWETVKQGKRTRVGNLIQLTTLRRNETTMEVTRRYWRLEDEDNEDDEEHRLHVIRDPGSRSVGSAVKTETGAKRLLHNISSEEDTFEGGWYSYCNVSSWRTCRVQKDHHHAKRWHFLWFHPALNLKIRALKLTSSAVTKVLIHEDLI